MPKTLSKYPSSTNEKDKRIAKKIERKPRTIGILDTTRIRLTMERNSTLSLYTPSPKW